MDCIDSLTMSRLENPEIWTFWRSFLVGLMRAMQFRACSRLSHHRANREAYQDLASL
jgi:hypothetical protein